MVLARKSWKETIRGEEVKVHSEEDAAEADQIIASIALNYGITIDGGELVKATRATYSEAPPTELKIKKRYWNLRELRAVEKACEFFAPILGGARAKSPRRSVAQDVTAFGKATTSLSDSSKKGKAAKLTYGEAFDEAKTVGIYQSAEHNRTFAGYPDVDRNLEWICIHELGHWSRTRPTAKGVCWRISPSR